MKSYLVIGASGLLGRSLLSSLGSRGIGTYANNPFPGGLHFDGRNHGFLDLLPNLPPSVSHVFLLHGVVNPDGCARDPAGTAEVNVVGMKSLIGDIWKAGLTPIYMSTDYVFDGNRGMRAEDEEPCPTTEYGRQKAAVEHFLRRSGEDFIVARSSKIVSGELNTHSVLGQWITEFKANRQIRAADDQVFSPMHVRDTVDALLGLSDASYTGVFNVCGNEAVSRYQLAILLRDAIYRVAPASILDVSVCKLSEIRFAEVRPLNTSLSNEKLRNALGLNFHSMPEVCAEVAAENFS